MARNLPCELSELCLDFRDCRLPAAGVRALAQNLPELLRLQDLRLHLGGCDLLAEDACIVMSQLPSSLEALQLGFEGCPLGASGAYAVAEGIPQGLRSLHLDLDWCNIQADGSVALSRNLPPQLEKLHLGLGGCSIGRDGACALAQSLQELSSLQSLRVDVARCRITVVGARALLQRLPLGSLQTMLLDFRACGIDIEERQTLRDLIPTFLGPRTVLF